MTKLKTNKIFLKRSRTIIRNKKKQGLKLNTKINEDQCVLFRGGKIKEEEKKTINGDKPSYVVVARHTKKRESLATLSSTR
jgi:imidazolonepropionase-like amidohydrolase